MNFSRENISKQRAVLMGVITGILEDTQEHTVEEIKVHLVRALEFFIDNDLLVGDFIDVQTIGGCMSFCDGEKAIEDVQEILNNLN